MEKPRKYFHIMDLQNSKPCGNSADSLFTDSEQMLLDELAQELYPALPGQEWHAAIDEFVAARFYEKLAPADPDTGCIQWLGACSVDGHPVISVAGAARKAAHVALIDAGRLPPTHDEGPWHAHHICRNTGCVSPDHLQWISPAEHAALHKYERDRDDDQSLEDDPDE